MAALTTSSVGAMGVNFAKYAWVATPKAGGMAVCMEVMSWSMGRRTLRLGGCSAQFIRMERLIWRVTADWSSSSFFSSICFAYLESGLAALAPWGLAPG